MIDTHTGVFLGDSLTHQIDVLSDAVDAHQIDVLSDAVDAVQHEPGQSLANSSTEH